ncbi:MAG: aminotransferase class I/II-fold pyridoxal phosphate-dependent enzyme [Chloroflexi bacterium]|nr:MAG: aminotransferase class I/II-fold pyridoxal phosphate-dependent enzyme [Chloroflexota bacterium]
MRRPLDQLARRTVLDLEPYSWELSSEAVAARHGLRVEDVLRFDLNTSPFPPGPWDAAMEGARREALPHEYFDTGYAELTPLFGAYCGVPGDHIVVGAGADEVLDIVAKTFLDNGDPTVTSDPSYAMYPIVTAQLGGLVRRVPLREDCGPDVAGLLAAARDAKILWFCNPNSPTSNSADPAEVERLVREAPCIVVIDEAYAEFAGWSAAPLVAANPNLVVVKTMSKAFSMAGMRLAWAVAQPAVVDLLNRVRPPNSVSRVTARLGAAALRDLDSMRANVRAVLAQRESLTDGLREAGARVYRSDTNFLLTAWGSPADARSLYGWLEARGMVVRNYADHPVLPGHLRITVRTAAQNARLVAAVDEWRSQK